jgi:3-dehydroquinate dehydratase-2
VSATIAIYNGPNLDQLGTREPHIYGHHTLVDIRHLCDETCQSIGLASDFRQTNFEGELLEWIHQASPSTVGLVLNAAALTHTSVALHDALRIYPHPIIEVHLSNTFKREVFRHQSYVSSLAHGIISGFGIDSYRLAILAMGKLRT